MGPTVTLSFIPSTAPAKKARVRLVHYGQVEMSAPPRHRDSDRAPFGWRERIAPEAASQSQTARNPETPLLPPRACLWPAAPRAVCRNRLGPEPADPFADSRVSQLMVR